MRRSVSSPVNGMRFTGAVAGLCLAGCMTAPGTEGANGAEGDSGDAEPHSVVLPDIGNLPAKNLLLEGLKRLEYRGYDSAGIAVMENAKLDIEKAVGRVSNLEAKLEGRKGFTGTLGIAQQFLDPLIRLPQGVLLETHFIAPRHGAAAMPLAGDGRGISGVTHLPDPAHLFGEELRLRLEGPDIIGENPGAVSVDAGHQESPRRPAHRRRKTGPESGAPRGEGIKVRRAGRALRIVAGKHLRTHIVGEDEDDVGPRLWRARFRSLDPGKSLDKEKAHQEGTASHVKIIKNL